MIIFGLGLWRRPELATKRDLLDLFEQKIMPTQKEIADGLLAVRGELSAVATEVAKVGAETDALNQKIVDLQAAVNNQTNASPELVAAFQAVKDQADAVAAGVKAVDDKVPDAPTAELPPT